MVDYYFSHLMLFGNEGRYNIKNPMFEKIGEAVVLCGKDGCRWVDYSAPGNILFGYLSAERGIIQPVAWFAGGYLESKDNGFINFDYQDTLFDNPGDKAAVDFGWSLHRKYPDGINLVQFQAELTTSILSSFQSPPNAPFFMLAYPQQNTYLPGEFLQNP